MNSMCRIKCQFTLKVIVFVILGGLSLLVHAKVGQYEKVGDQLLTNSTFENNFEDWIVHSGVGKNITRHGDGVRFISGNADTSVQMAQKLDFSMLSGRVMLKASLKSKDIKKGEEGLADENVIYTVARRGLLLGWFVFVVVLIGPLYKNLSSSKILRLLAVMALAGIIIGTTLPGKLKNSIKADISQAAYHYTNGVVSLPFFANTSWFLDITKLAHFCLFAIFSFLFFYLQKKKNHSNIFFDIFLLAAITEMMQLFIEGRGPLFADVVLDMAGCLAGYLLFRFNRKRLFSRDTAG